MLYGVRSFEERRVDLGLSLTAHGYHRQIPYLSFQNISISQPLSTSHQDVHVQINAYFPSALWGYHGPVLYHLLLLLGSPLEG